jgi:hypothetical protein
MAEIIGNLRFNNSQDIDILNQFHHVFWLGDVNYRLNFKAKGDSSKYDKHLFFIFLGTHYFTVGSLAISFFFTRTFSWGEVVKCIERKDYQTLFQYDEVRISSYIPL